MIVDRGHVRLPASTWHATAKVLMDLKRAHRPVIPLTRFVRLLYTHFDGAHKPMSVLSDSVLASYCIDLG